MLLLDQEFDETFEPVEPARNEYPLLSIILGALVAIGICVCMFFIAFN